jgi:hypothetical protein
MSDSMRCFLYCYYLLVTCDSCLFSDMDLGTVPILNTILASAAQVLAKISQVTCPSRPLAVCSSLADVRRLCRCLAAVRISQSARAKTSASGAASLQLGRTTKARRPVLSFVLGNRQARLLSETPTPPDTLGTIALGARHLHGVHSVPAMRPAVGAAFSSLVADDPAFPFVDSVPVEPLDCIKQL